MSRFQGPFLAVIFVVVLSGMPALAGFVDDGACVFTGTFDQEEPQIASDGAGGAFIV